MKDDARVSSFPNYSRRSTGMLYPSHGPLSATFSWESAGVIRWVARIPNCLTRDRIAIGGGASNAGTGTSMTRVLRWTPRRNGMHRTWSEVRHEIGSHSFSHTDLSDANCPPEVAQGELRRCQEEASQKGIGLRSFVFPGNFEGNFAALRENGFIAYRGGDGVDLSYPEKAHGLWNIRESLQLFDPEVDYSRRLPLYVEAAIRAQVACHLSFHPSEPSAATVSGVLLPALAYLKSLEARGDIWIATMEELASYCEARSSALVREVSPLDWIVKWGHDPDRYPRAAITFSVPWAGSSPTCEVDDEEAAERGQSCFVRSGRLYMTITHPHSALRVRRV